MKTNELLRRPPHPGEVLRKSFLEKLGVTIPQLSESTGISESHLRNIVNEKRSVTNSVALKLSLALNTSYLRWVTLQADYDRDNLSVEELRELVRICSVVRKQTSSKLFSTNS